MYNIYLADMLYDYTYCLYEHKGFEGYDMYINI